MVAGLVLGVSLKKMFEGVWVSAWDVVVYLFFFYFFFGEGAWLLRQYCCFTLYIMQDVALW